MKYYLLALLSIFIIACESDGFESFKFKTEYVILVVIDGPRYSETWGHPEHLYQPKLSKHLASKGVIYTQFYNNGPTYTNAGHTALTTGNYQEIDNSGAELPQNPSVFQYWLKSSGKKISSAWIVASKDKLQVLSDCIEASWHGQFTPSTNCGINGLGVGSGYRPDSLTIIKTLSVLNTYHPNLLLVNFREPDYSAHKNDWDAYIKGIIDTDQYVYELIQFVESNPIYKDKTTIFVTNDHGRHLNDVSNGFVSHGDDCDGCRHINLFVYGPDIKEGVIEDTRREQVDIPATIAELLDFEFDNGTGVTMSELFTPIDQ